MNLMRLVPEVADRLRDEDLRLLAPAEQLADYEVAFDRALVVDDLATAFEAFQGRPLSSADDGAMAIEVRKFLPLNPREAADRQVWWWLAVRCFPDIVQARWTIGDPPRLTTERMLGQINRNAFARLWWGAQMVRGLAEPERFTQLLFKNQDLFEALIGRSLSRYPVALGVLLEELSPLTGELARRIVRDLRFILSTLVLEALTADLLREEVQRLISKSEAGG